MSTISTALRNFKEPTKEQVTQIFFSLPSVGSLDGTEKTPAQEVEKMDINAVLSLGVQGEEDAYVGLLLTRILSITYYNAHNAGQAGKLYIMSPFLAFASLDRKSVRFTIPLSTIRRVERLNARAGIYALSLSTWHGAKIVSGDFVSVHWRYREEVWETI